MSNLILNDKSIQNVVIIDDIAEARNSMSDMVDDAGFSAIPILEIKEHSIGDFVSKIIEISDAAVFDHNLAVGGYANFNGAEAVECLYDKNFPAILLTQIQGYDRLEIGYKRKKIPCFIDGSEVDVHKIHEGLERCVREFKQDYPSDRRPYRTVARIESIDLSESHGSVVELIIPAWSTTERVQLPYDDVYSRIGKELQPDLHLVAEINIGADYKRDLFVDNIEVAKEIDNELAELIRS